MNSELHLFEKECNICYELTSVEELECCKKEWCKQCKKQYSQPTCPFCRQPLAGYIESVIIINNNDVNVNNENNNYSNNGVLFLMLFSLYGTNYIFIIFHISYNVSSIINVFNLVLLIFCIIIDLTLLICTCLLPLRNNSYEMIKQLIIIYSSVIHSLHILLIVITNLYVPFVFNCLYLSGVIFIISYFTHLRIIC